MQKKHKKALRDRFISPKATEPAEETVATSEFGRFGPFAIAFEQNPCYLSLLNLYNSDDSKTVVTRIKGAVAAGNTQQWVNRLLAEPNWRPHLVAAIVYLLDSEPQLSYTPLWRAIDAQSWVTPQLIITAMLKDRDFATCAVDRMEDAKNRNCKLVASILSVSNEIPALATRATIWRANPQIREMLADDESYDNSNEIISNWLTAIREIVHIK